MVTRDASARSPARCHFAAVALLLGFALLAPATATAHSGAIENPIGVHSMLYLNHPYSAKQAMFKEAAATGASEIRLDIELSGVFPNPNQAPDWSGIDQYMSLARRYHLRVLADLLATPWYLVSCPPGTPTDQTYLCPPGNPALWGDEAGAIAAHTRGVINDFEIINEPDGSWAFLGTPQQYAALLTASYHAIHHVNPNARVALGGLMDIGSSGRKWMNEVLGSLGNSSVHPFDIANIHVRTTAAQTGNVVTAWRRYFATKHFTGPLWVTETGYPADPTQQTDPAYQDGPEAQARYLNAIIPAMIRAGAAKVFITERDSLTGPYASEGILNTTDPLTANPRDTRRPSFYTIQRLARREWPKATRSPAALTGRRRSNARAPRRTSNTGRRPCVVAFAQIQARSAQAPSVSRTLPAGLASLALSPRAIQTGRFPYRVNPALAAGGPGRMPALVHCPRRERQPRPGSTRAPAQTQASAIAPADDRFRPGCATELTIALATTRWSRPNPSAPNPPASRRR
jgi:hypothetical protein